MKLSEATFRQITEDLHPEAEFALVSLNPGSVFAFDSTIPSDEVPEFLRKAIRAATLGTQVVAPNYSDYEAL